MLQALNYREMYLAGFEERSELEAKLLDAEAKRAAVTQYADQLFNDLDLARKQLAMVQRTAEKRGETVRALAGELRTLTARLHRLLERDGGMHFNPADDLPPVDCPLLLNIEGKLRRAERVCYIQSRGDSMEYRLDDGQIVMGRFPWTYP